MGQMKAFLHPDPNVTRFQRYNHRKVSKCTWDSFQDKTVLLRGYGDNPGKASARHLAAYKEKLGGKK